MMQLLLVRHGQTEENVRQVLQGQSPGHLTAQGYAEARELAARLEKLRGQVACVFSSDLERAVRTAEIIAGVLQLPVLREPLLRERDFGELTGRSIAEVRALSEMPPTVESVEAMRERARLFLERVARAYDGGTVLAVSHGLYLRGLQGVWAGCPLQEIPPMRNCEVRTLQLELPASPSSPAACSFQPQGAASPAGSSFAESLSLSDGEA